MSTAKHIGIIGAGVAGLSVARELLELTPQTLITIFDSRPRLPHPERTFCFFKPSEVFTIPQATTSWNTISFRGSTFTRTIHVPDKPYTLINGDDFFAYTLKLLESGGVTFHWESPAEAIDSQRIKSAHGYHTFDCVIDASFEKESLAPLLWQSFAGLWIETSTPIFEASTALIMDIAPSSSEAPVSFFYVLPTSPQTALVEHTTFSPTILEEEYHLTRCHTWLEQNISAPILLKRTERGAIPMGIFPKKSTGIFRIGSNSGAVRSATGYAFIKIQKQARALACHIVQGSLPSKAAYPRWLEMGDRLFLQALYSSPASGADFMERLLSRASNKNLVAFLSDESSFLQTLLVWLTVPKRKMLRALLCG